MIINVNVNASDMPGSWYPFCGFVMINVQSWRGVAAAEGLQPQSGQWGVRLVLHSMDTVQGPGSIPGGGGSFGLVPCRTNPPHPMQVVASAICPPWFVYLSR